MANFFHLPIAEAAGAITDAPKISSILLSFLNFLLSIVAVVAIIALVVGGIWYLTAGGSEERLQVAKRACLSGVVGLVIALSALILTGALASFFQ